MNRKKWSVRVIISLVLLLFITRDGLAHDVELNGFMIYQFRNAVKNALGKPFQTGATEQSEYEAYSIGDDAHMVFEFLKDRRDWVYSIQLSGTRAKNMEPFNGLVLGDSRERVISRLGKPDSVEKVKDGKKELLRYAGRNCSVELDSKGVLVSIRIYGYEDLFKSPDGDNEKNWEAFRDAVLRKDVLHIAGFFRPDAEIYKDNEVLSIDTAFKAFFRDGKRKFLNAIVADFNSVCSELRKTTPETDFRLHEKMGAGFVHKFRESKVLEEIYFLPYAGRWRIYEVRFRDNL